MSSLRQHFRVLGLLALLTAASPAVAQRRVWYSLNDVNIFDHYWCANTTGANNYYHGEDVADRSTGITTDFLSRVWYESDVGRNGRGYIFRGDYDGSSFQFILDSSAFAPYYVVQDGVGGRLYFFDGHSNSLYQLENTGGTPLLVFNIGDNITSLAIHTGTHNLYFTAASSGLLGRVHTDGSGNTSLLDNARFVAVNEAGNQIFWWDKITKDISKGDLNGGGSQLVRNVSNMDWLAVDGLGAKVYWSDRIANRLFRANMDGTGLVETVITPAAGNSFVADHPFTLELGPFACQRTVPYGDQPGVTPGAIDIADVARIVDCFKDVPYTHGDNYLACDVYPCALSGGNPACAGDGIVNISDVARDVDLFKGIHVDGCPPREPRVHRAVATPCPTERGPGDFMPDLTEDCGADSECMDGANGRCMASRGGAVINRCTYDMCFADSECTQAVCDCRPDATSNAPNLCLGGNCMVDFDCGPGGYCSPSVAFDRVNYPYAGYWCHTAEDTCLDDEDCISNASNTARCAFDTTAGHWACSDALFLPP